MGAGTVPSGKEVTLGRRYERLTTPLVRDGDGLRPASWDEALGRTAAGLGAAKGTSVGMFSCSKGTNEMNYTAQKFARTVLHTNNVDSCNRT